MNACPDEDELLRFLDGELGGQDDARIVVHVEDCAGCQERLERLTRGRLDQDDETSIEAVRCDRGRHDVLTETEVEGPALRSGEAGDRRSTDLGEAPGLAVLDRDSTVGWAAPAEAARQADVGGGGGYSATLDRDLDRTDSLAWAAPDSRGNPLADSPAHWPVVAGYEILHRLGEGGMGVVYKARHHGLDRLVALKMIRGGSQARAEAFTRFRVEAESVARLRHPNIIQIYDIGEAGGLPFVALELLDGRNLAQRLAGNPQPGRPAAELVATLARAVEVAHQSGIIHRDLKPANVLYTADGVPRITDFGLAKRIDSDDGHTQSGQVMGSPSYMAPEQARGHSRDVGPAADIYALGAILYEMLTGRPPFKGQTPMETVRQVIDDDPVTPSHLVPRIPRDLETICLKCLRKDAARRYGSAQALADDLQRYLDRKPIEARRTPAWERAAKWARRRPMAAGLSGVAVSLCVAGFLGIIVYQGSLLKRERTITHHVTTGHGLDREADAARSDGELERAWERLSGFLLELKPFQDDPRIEELTERLVANQADVSGRRAALQTQRSEKDQRHAESEQLQIFRTRRYDALVHDTQFTGLDLAGDREPTRRAAMAALKIYAATGSGASWELGPLPAQLSDADRAEIVEGCYELLLVLSRAETTPERGLQRLDEAARLPLDTMAYHLRRAECLELASRKPEAEQERRRAGETRPMTAFDHFLVGRERYQHAEPIEALRHLNLALDLEPGHFWAQCLSAVCWLQLKRPETALAGLNACLQRERDLAWLHLLRGLANLELAEVFSGRDPFRQFADIQYDAAENDYRRAGELLEKNPVAGLQYSLLVNRGVLWLRRGDLARATGFFRQAIALDASQYPAYASLAEVYQKQGKDDEALDQLSLAIAHRPDWAPLYRARADVVRKSKSPTPAQRAQALSDLDRAIRLEKPDNLVLARDHTNRGRLLAVQGDITGAIAACEAAIERVRGYEDAHQLRLDLLLRLKRHDEVIRSCDPIIARGTASAAIYERRALAREAIRDFPGAIEDFTSAIALKGDRPKLLRRRGWLYIVADAPRLALHDFEEAIRLDSSSGDAYNGRGFARLRFGEHRAAVADAEKAISLGEATPNLFYNAARVYALAAVVVSAEVRKQGQDSVRLWECYQDRATDLLRAVIRMQPAGRRDAFVKDVVLADRDLRTLRRRLSSMDLAGAANPAQPRRQRPD